MGRARQRETHQF